MQLPHLQVLVQVCPRVHTCAHTRPLAPQRFDVGIDENKNFLLRAKLILTRATRHFENCLTHTPKVASCQGEKQFDSRRKVLFLIDSRVKDSRSQTLPANPCTWCAPSACDPPSPETTSQTNPAAKVINATPPCPPPPSTHSLKDAHLSSGLDVPDPQEQAINHIRRKGDALPVPRESDFTGRHRITP